MSARIESLLSWGEVKFLKVSGKRIWVVILVITLMACTSAFTYAAAQSLGSRVISYGMTGADVQELQKLLNSKGYWVGNADGIVGSQTLGALQSNVNGLYTVKKGDSLYSISLTYKTTVNRIKELNGLTADIIYPGQVLKVSSGQTKALSDIIRSKGISNPVVGFRIVVDKSDHVLAVYSGNAFLKSYKVSVGEGGMEDKQKAGDRKTPEGNFYVTEMSAFAQPDQYFGTRWMELSYPDAEHAKKGLDSGLIDRATYDSIVNANNNRQMPPQNTALGGGIGIHGGNDTNGTDDWTWGCVGLFNSDVQEIYNYVKIGTEVVIQQ